MKNAKKPVPDGYHTLTPYLVITGAAWAIDFYKKAFGAEELYRMEGPGGIVSHGELQIGDSRLMVTEEEAMPGTRSPATLKGSPVGLFLYVPDADKTFMQAIAAGVKVVVPLADMPWGDRWGKVLDPFGHEWQIATRKLELTPKEIEERMAAVK